MFTLSEHLTKGNFSSVTLKMSVSTDENKKREASSVFSLRYLLLHHLLQLVHSHGPPPSEACRLHVRHLSTTPTDRNTAILTVVQTVTDGLVFGTTQNGRARHTQGEFPSFSLRDCICLVPSQSKQNINTSFSDILNFPHAYSMVENSLHYHYRLWDTIRATIVTW